LHELTVHILGTGSVGLAYGYLLTNKGHRVFHTSLRGLTLGNIPICMHNSTETIHSMYAPQYLLSEDDSVVPDLNIFAVPQTVCLQYLSGAYGPLSFSSLSYNLFFTSAYDPSEYQSSLAKYDYYSCLVYPLISCEYSVRSGLNIVTDSLLEVFLSQTRSMRSNSSLFSLFTCLGLNVSYYTTPYRLRVRYIQTSAIYIILRMLYLGIIESSGVDGTLIQDIFTELSSMAELVNAELLFDSSLAPRAYFSLISSLILACRAPRRGDVLLHNLNYLLISGQRKVASHLNAIRIPWLSYFSLLPVSSHTKTQLIISTVLSSC
jgi:hypothetical protein